MLSNISILIINSSHKSIDNLISILKAKILSKQRPNIACLSHEEFNNEINLKSFIENFLSIKSNEFLDAVDKVRKINEFNQLDVWKNDKNKRRISNLRMKQKNENKSSNDIILDYPSENNFYLILFDVYDCEVIKLIASFEFSSPIGLVNLYPRNMIENSGEMIKSENFWKELLQVKHTKDFENVAFMDLDVPVESNYILNMRSQLIYDQFCHFFYDFEQLKFLYKHYFECLLVHDVNTKVSASDENDFRQLQKKLDQIPHEMLNVEDIYDAVMEQIAQDESVILFESSLEKFMEIEAFGKKIYDMNDVWRKGYAKNPTFYAHKILKLEESCNDIWNNIDIQQSIEQKQILNYFMNKVIDHLRNNKKEYDSIEFYFYVMQFKNWHHAENLEIHEREFYENRSVGHKKLLTNDATYPRKVTSDACIGYRNSSAIPAEFEQLINCTLKMDAMENVYVKCFSRPAMLQHIENLKKNHKKFHRQYSKIFDTLLINFPSQKVPKKFSSNIYTKTLSTPLCFRDINDYKKYEMSMDNRQKNEINVECTKCSAKGDDKCSINYFEHEKFILPMSIKFQQKPFERNDTKSDVNIETIAENENRKISNAGGAKEEVYNVSNRRIELRNEECEFQSFQLSIKASVFTWMNFQKHLNFVCTLHDRVKLSYSYDIRTNLFNNVTLTDENITGMICSIDIDNNNNSNNNNNNNNNVMLSFPHGMIIKIIDDDTVEINWMELIEHSHNNAYVETKRTYFSNGFIMIHMLNDVVRIYSSNGTIFELTTSKKGNDKRNSKLTEIYKFYISSIHFLQKYINVSAFVMTLPSGNRFIVENGWIVEELKPLYQVREYFNKENGNFYAFRSDGLKVVHANSYTKCLFEDGTVITKTYSDCDDIATTFDAENAEMNKPISILDEIWLSDAEKESKMLIDDVLNFVNDDYFVDIRHSCLFEHEKYGTFKFIKNGIEMKLFNGLIVKKQYGNCSIALNGIYFQIDSTKMEFYDEKCEKCLNNNKIVVKHLTFSDESEECKNNETLLSANDIDGSLLEIKRNGRQMFYEKLQPKMCQQCESSKKLFVMKNYGERWIVVNRDMSGYEISSHNPMRAYNHINSSRKTWMETNDAIMLCCSDDLYEIEINNDDFLIEFPATEKNNDINDDESLMTSSSNQTLNKGSTNLLATRKSHVNVNSSISKKKSRQSKKILNSFEINHAAIDKPLHMASPLMTMDDSSLSSDIVWGREIIQYYSNPLLNLPESISVSAFFKLQHNKFTDVIEALCHLRKQSCEKFIIDVEGLIKAPVQTTTFQEHFKFIVKRSIEEYVREKLKLFRERMARAIIEDLLQSAFERLFERSSRSSSIKIDTCLSENEKGLHVSKDDNSSFDSIYLLPSKSFSFV